MHIIQPAVNHSQNTIHNFYLPLIAFFFICSSILFLSPLSVKSDTPVDLAIVNSISKEIKKPVSFQISFVETPIQLDGKLDDITWKNTHFFSFNGPNNNRTNRTEFAIAQNKFGLYIAFRCYALDISNLQTTCEIRDGLFEYFRKDDWVELLLAPGNTGNDYYWFIVNAAGMQTDLCCQADPDRSWNGEWKAVTGHEDNIWTVEMFLPFPIFNRTIPGNKWRFNAARLYVGGSKSTHKRTIWRGQHRNPATWSTLTGVIPYFNKFNFKVSPLVIKPDIKQNCETITATVQNLTHTNLEIIPIFKITRPGSAMGLVPHGWGPSEYIPAGKFFTRTNNITISAPINMNQDEIVIAQLLLRDKANNLLYTTRDIGISPQNIIDGAGPELNLYTTEKKANLLFNLRQYGKNMQLIVNLEDANKKILTHNIPAISPFVEDTIKIATLPPGTYKISAELKNDNILIAHREYQLHKATILHNGVVKINRSSRSLQIDEKPFVAVGNSPGISHGLTHARAMMREMAKNGFNTIHLWGGYLKKDKNKKLLPELDQETLHACLDSAATNNLKVIISLGTITQNNPASPFIKFNITDQQRINLILEIVNSIKNQDALLGYEIADEPEWFVAPDWLEKVYKAIKQIDPGHLVTINNCRGTRSIISYARASDIASLDYYPIGKWPAATVGPLTSEIVSIAGYRPVSMWIQGYKIFNPREPLPAEVIMMSYSMFARGASELFYFIGKPKPSLWAAQTQCAREITSLNKAAATRQKFSLTTIPKSNIYASLRISDYEGWIIAVNESDKAITANIVLPAGITPENISVLFESRRILTRNNQITDKFMPFARHVYHWK